MVFRVEHFAFLILSIVAWFWQPYAGSDQQNADGVKRWKRAPLAPSPWVFGIVWLILYGVNIAAWMYFFDFAFLNDPNLADVNVAMSAVLLVATWILLKMWYPAYFYYNSVIAGAVIIVLAFAACVTSIIFLALAGILGAVILLIPLAIWLLFAMYLNLWTACNQPRRGAVPESTDGPLV